MSRTVDCGWTPAEVVVTAVDADSDTGVNGLATEYCGVEADVRAERPAEDIPEWVGWPELAWETRPLGRRDEEEYVL